MQEADRARQLINEVWVVLDCNPSGSVGEGIVHQSFQLSRLGMRVKESLQRFMRGIVDDGNIMDDTAGIHRIKVNIGAFFNQLPLRCGEMVNGAWLHAQDQPAGQQYDRTAGGEILFHTA